MYVLAYVWVCACGCRCPWKPEEGVRSPGAGVMSYERPCGYWGLNLGLL